MVAAEEW